MPFTLRREPAYIFFHSFFSAHFCKLRFFSVGCHSTLAPFARFAESLLPQTLAQHSSKANFYVIICYFQLFYVQNLDFIPHHSFSICSITQHAFQFITFIPIRLKWAKGTQLSFKFVKLALKLIKLIFQSYALAHTWSFRPSCP